jgi:peptidyl-prolyl cis-trans isomerase B (cyclophilin B)
MSTARSLRLTAACLAGLLVVAACGGGDGESAAASSDETSSTDAAATTSPPITLEVADTPPADYAGFRSQPTACDASAPAEIAPAQFDAPDDMAIDPTETPEATLTTSCGDIVIALDPSSAPATVNSFVFLAESGYFDGTAAHRVAPGFVVQAGDPTATGTGNPGYVVPDEPPADGFIYTRGTVAMANAGAGTTGSQFFIMLADGALPPLYSVFGEVTEGLDVLDTIATVPVGIGRSGERSTPLETVYIESVTIER